MAEEKSKGKLFIYAIITVLLFFGLIRLFINSNDKFFMLELVGTLFLLLLTLIGFIGYNKCWGERVLFFVYLFYLVNLVLIWFHDGRLSLILLFLTLLAFLMAIPKRACCSDSCKSSCKVEEEPHSEVFDLPKPVEKKEVVEENKVTHSPGKFVASARSNIYHEPKCEWAKKIKKDRQVWFKDKREAQRKGHRKHSCV
jgi:hypothetical protein